MRLLQWALGSLGEFDGRMLWKNGRGIEGLTPRQLCNAMFAWAMEGRDADAREELIEELEMPLDPMAQANLVWKKHKME